MSPSSHPLYNTWRLMKRRCYQVSDSAYHHYGGRGIKMCDRWLNDFWAFVEDVGERPPGHSLDRIDNDGDYEPGNVRWATQSQQLCNSRSARMITWDGRTQSAALWAKELGVTKETMYQRLRNWPLDRAMTEPRHAEAANNVRRVA